MKQNLLALVLEQGFKINIMKVTIPFVLMIGLVLQTSFVRAQISSELEPVSLAVVDFRGVLSKSEAARNIRSVVDEKRQELRKYFLEVENSLRDEQKDLSKHWFWVELSACKLSWKSVFCFQLFLFFEIFSQN